MKFRKTINVCDFYSIRDRIDQLIRIEWYLLKLISRYAEQKKHERNLSGRVKKALYLRWIFS